MKLILQIEQTINGEVYAYAAEASTDIELEPSEVAQHFVAVGSELQAMADSDRAKVRRFDWSRIIPSLN